MCRKRLFKFFVVFWVVAAPPLAQASTSFSRLDVASGLNPQAVVAGDLDRDGHLDLLVTNSAANTVSVLLGNGAGSFGPKSDYLTGTTPVALAAGDFNRDGKVDLALVNSTANTVSILLGSGNGTLGVKTDFVTSSGPVSVTAADFNRDGKLDLAICNGGSNTASILLGNGDGSFGSKTDFATGSNPQWLVNGDFDGNGKIDLAVVNAAADSISVLLGNGNGTFGPKTDFATGTGPGWLVAGDFNGDGKSDLAVANAGAGTISILLGNGAGSFGPKTDFVIGNNPSSIAVADFNRDGRLDLAIAGQSSGISVLLGRGNGSFDSDTTLSTDASPQSVIAADFNGDGKPDLANLNQAVNSVSVFVNTTPLARPAELFRKTDFATGDGPVSVATGDFNGDGALDLVTVNVGTSTASILLGSGNGAFGAKIDYGTASVPRWVIAEDFNRDGKLDLAIATSNFSRLSVLLGNGDGTFGSHTDFDTGLSPLAVVAGDFNGDGVLDLATANTVGTVSIFLGQGNGGFGSKTDFTVGGNPAGLVAGDFNRDGKPDLAVVNRIANTISVLAGNGDGTFAPKTDYATGSGPVGISEGDFNRDGKLDLATVNEAVSGHEVSVLLGNGDGTFGAKTDFASDGGAAFITPADLNSDGKLDLITANGGTSVSVLLGNGDGSFGVNKNYTTGDYPIFAAAGDFNRDGKTDIATANDFNTNTVSVLLNLTPDLAMSKGHSGSFVVGSNGVYTLTVSNVGDVNISGPISVTDTLPAGLSFVSATGANWSCLVSSQTVNCNAGQLAAGATSTIKLTVAVGSAAFPRVTNTATVANASDTNPANNSSANPTTVVFNTAPAVGTLTPASGTSAAGATVSFNTTYTDADGFAQLATGYFLVNTALSATNAAYGYYNKTANAFYWRNDANTASLGPCTPGQSAVLENSYSKLNCAASTVSGSGTTLTVIWNVTFKASFVTSAVKNIYLQAADDAGASSGWVQKGTRLVGSNTAPAAGTLTPASGISAADAMVSFTTTYSDANGHAQMATGYFLVNTTLSATNAAYGYYNQNANAFYWGNDANTASLGPCTPGQAAVLENSYSKLNCAASTVSGSGTTLTVTWKVIFKTPFVTTAVKKVYLQAADDAGASSGWVQKGTWLVGPNTAPAVGTLTPASGRSAADTTLSFTTTYTDANGYGQLATGYFLVNTVLSGTHAAYGYYNQNANAFYWGNDANTASLGPCTPGQSAVLENSYSKLNCAASIVSGNGTTLTVTWRVTFKAPFVTTAVKNIYLLARDDAGASSGWVQKGTRLVGPNTAPAVGALTPASGTSAAGATVSFRTTYTDANGYGQLATGYFLVNTVLSGTHAAYGYYNQNSNAFYWRNDADTASLGPCTPGQASVLENSYSRLNCAASTVSGSGTTLTVTWNVTFKASFVTSAVKNIYLQAADDAGASSGWSQKGAWLVGPNTAPAVGTVTPASGRSAADAIVSFKTTYSDANGYTQLATGYLLVNTALSGTNAAYGYYNQNANAFYWRNDADTATLGPCTPGQAAVLENSYSKLNCAASSVSGSGTTLTVTWNVTFKAPFVTTAVKNIYLQAADYAGASTGWVQKGTWLVGPNTAPAPGTLTPASGMSAAGEMVSFKTTYADANGYMQLATGYFLVNTALSATNAAYGYYNQNANAFYWGNDANTASLGPCAPGQAAVLENSYSKLNCAASTVSGSGTTLTITWNVTFKAPFVTTAVKNIYLQAADDAGASTGWSQKGTWLVGPNTAPAVGAVTPASGTSAADAMVNFTTTYTDANGYGQLATGYFLVNTALSGTNAAYGYYNQNDNALYWRNDAGTVWLGPCTPGQATVLENGYSKLDCAASTVSGSGVTLTVTWTVSFKAPFVTSAVKKIYLLAYDDAGASSGWVQKGTWQFGPEPPASGALLFHESPAGNPRLIGGAQPTTETRHH